MQTFNLRGDSPMSGHPSGINPAEFPEPFASQYRAHLQHLQLKGLQPKTIKAYARAMRRIGAHFQSGAAPAAGRW
jgi:hypothetical protein